MASLPAPITVLIGSLNRLPGIGPRSAERLALHLVQADTGAVQDLANAILNARQRIRFCSVCGALTEESPCSTCADPRRDASLLCVIERAVDILSLEKSGTYRGKYHVLGGKISPLNGVRARGPHYRPTRTAALRPNPSWKWSSRWEPMWKATPPSYYLAKRLARPGLKITRIAHGLPAGTGLEFADELTLSRALEGRREM